MKFHPLVLAIATASATVCISSAVAQDDTAITPAVDDATEFTEEFTADESAAEDTSSAPDPSLCSTIAATSRWAGSDRPGSDLSRTDSALNVDLSLQQNDTSVVVFELSETTDIRVEAVGYSATDPFVTIIDETGAQVASDDDSGGSYDALIEGSLNPGAYCVVTTDVNGNPASISLRLGRMEHDAITQAQEQVNVACRSEDLAQLSDSPLDSVMLVAGIQASASVTQTPAWGFTLTDPARVSITARSVSGDPSIQLLDSSGTVIDENDDADGTNSRIDSPATLPAGDYCLAMRDLNGDSNRIDVNLSILDERADRLRRITAVELAPLPEDDVEIRSVGSIDTSLVTDVEISGEPSWIHFDMPFDGVISLEAIGMNNDPLIVLFDQIGRRLGEDDDGSNNLDSLLLRHLRAGSYLLAIRTTDMDTPGTVRMVLKRFVPAK